MNCKNIHKNAWKSGFTHASLFLGPCLWILNYRFLFVVLFFVLNKHEVTRLHSLDIPYWKSCLEKKKFSKWLISAFTHRQVRVLLQNESILNCRPISNPLLFFFLKSSFTRNTAVFFSSRLWNGWNAMEHCAIYLLIKRLLEKKYATAGEDPWLLLNTVD